MKEYKSKFYGGEEKPSIKISFKRLSEFSKLPPDKKKDAAVWMAGVLGVLESIRKDLRNY